MSAYHMIVSRTMENYPLIITNALLILSTELNMICIESIFHSKAQLNTNITLLSQYSFESSHEKTCFLHIC